MSTRLHPRLGWMLLAVLALAGFLALQPAPDDDLSVARTDRPERSAPGQMPQQVRQERTALPAGQRAQPASRSASTPTPQQARDLTLWAAAWQRRSAEEWPAAPADARWSWASQQPPPPPPPPPPVQEVVAPMAPVFPYAWVGRYVDDRPRAVISGPNRTWVLRQGDEIDGQWRVGAVAERQLTVTYLPLNQDQTVALK